MPAMVRALAIVLLFLSITACNNEKKEERPKERFFPVLGFIRSQVANVDTSVYSIMKITYIDSVHTDTAFLKREEFAAAAKDFLTLPDIFQPAYKDRYKEEDGFDGTLNLAFLFYTPKNPESEIIKEQQIWIRPDPSGDRPSSIIINAGISTKDSVVEKKLTWWTDRSFLVYMTKQLPGQPEVTTNFKVIWNEGDE
jgi:hypothetical protein